MQNLIIVINKSNWKSTRFDTKLCQLQNWYKYYGNFT